MRLTSAITTIALLWLTAWRGVLSSLISWTWGPPISPQFKLDFFYDAFPHSISPQGYLCPSHHLIFHSTSSTHSIWPNVTLCPYFYFYIFMHPCVLCPTAGVWLASVQTQGLAWGDQGRLRGPVRRRWRLGIPNPTLQVSTTRWWWSSVISLGILCLNFLIFQNEDVVCLAWENSRTWPQASNRRTQVS